ncbi:hypothetical protein [Brevibacillus laterosporus]|uniref:hypothetical protein n=1 Tax=Brevibacillus laterosporus TaxID=1465 RepID=UPI003D19630A
MAFQITAKFFFNGDMKKVDWLERGIAKKGTADGKDVEIQPTREEVEAEFRKLFLRYMTEKKVMTVPNIEGELSVIPFEKVYYATVSVSEYTKETSD